MLRKVVCGLAVVALGSSLMFARQGGVVPGGDRTYADVTPAPDSPEGILKDVRDNLKALNNSKNRDVATRITMAKFAIEKEAWEAAREALDDAANIEPKNPDVASMMASIRPHLPLPSTVPATNPAVVPNPANPLVPAPVKAANTSFTAKRQVTLAEINRIRQIEWRPDETPVVPITIDSDTKKKFLAANTDILPADFNKMSVGEQADLILTKGREELHKNVIIVRDPASVAEFKKNVLQIVTASCATTGCHTGPKAGSFALFTGPSPAVVYTDFLVLQKYVSHVNGVERSLVDRDYPESSLLLQFLLEPTLSDTPHPNVPNFHPAVRKKEDPRYGKILKWIQGLKPINPHYGIDLSTEEGAGSESPKTPANAPRKPLGK